MKITSACAAAALSAVTAQAADMIPGPVPIEGIVSVYDGDTFTASAAIWPDVIVETSVRVNGVDTPEIRGKCRAEKTKAKAARDAVRSWLQDAEHVELINVEHGKYAGRVVATVLVDGEDLAERLITTGYGRRYDSGSREPWCSQ